MEPGALPKDKVDQLDREFEAAHPGVTVVRVAKSFEDLTATEKLAATDPATAPDVLLTLQGWNDMVPLAKAGLIIPLTSYATKFGWDKRFYDQILKVNSVTKDGTKFGTGDLYGLSFNGEFLGVFYNRAKLQALGLSVPTTLDGFVHALDVAKSKGEVPIAAGTSEQWPAAHLYMALQDVTADKQTLRDWIFASTPSATFDTPQNVEAGALLQDWVKKGYFSNGLAGVSVHDALQQFASGSGVFFIQGTWNSAEILKAMGTNVGIFLLPSNGQPLAATGGPGPSYSITKWSKNPDVAAEFLDFRSSAHADDLLVASGGLPAAAYQYSGSDPLTKDTFEAWDRYLQSDAQISFLDYAAPLLDVMSSGAQELVGLKITPQQFVQKMQAQYAKNAH